MSNHSFATAINCIDGRTQIPVAQWMKANLAVEFVDMITEPGADKAVAEGYLQFRETLRSKVMVSVNAHGSRVVAIVAHHDCAGNQVSREDHLLMLRKGVETVKGWNAPVRVLGLWVNSSWQVEKIVDTGEQRGEA